MGSLQVMSPAQQTWTKAATDRHLRAGWAVLAGIVDKWDTAGILNIVDTEWSEFTDKQKRALSFIHGDGGVKVKVRA